MSTESLNTYRNQPDESGRFGIHGGRFVAETLMPLILNVESAYNAARNDKNFGVDLAFYENKSNFSQKIESIKKKLTISGNISYMTCNESMCIPYDLPFEIKVNPQD